MKRLFSVLLVFLLFMSTTVISSVANSDTYTVTVIGNGGNGGEGGGEFAPGEEVTISLWSTPNGYNFAGWDISPAVEFTGNAGIATAPVSFIMPESDVTVETLIAPIGEGYSVTVLSDGNGIAYTTTISAGPLTSISIWADPNSGFHFKEWKVISGNALIVNGATIGASSPFAFVMQNTDVVVKAFFEVDSGPEVKYPLTVINGSGGYEYTAGEVVTITADQTPAGQIFKQWEFSSEVTVILDGKIQGTWNTINPLNYWGESGLSLQFTMPSLATTVTAIYENDPYYLYSITYLSDGNGSIISNRTSAMTGETIGLPSSPNTGRIPNEGYQFKEWQVINVDVVIEKSMYGDDIFIMPSKNVVLKAIFERIPGYDTPEPNTIFSTGHESNFWNWFKFIVLFGWIWMWF